MIDRFTSAELQQAILALNTIDRDGDPDQWAYVLREAQDAAPAIDPWQNVSIGTRPAAEAIARRLSAILGVSVESCFQAAQNVFARDRGRVIFDALLGYAAELGQPSHRESRVTPKPTQRPSIRIVGDDERGVA